ncbi:chromosomal replication initiation ATPase DnaA [Evansella vedderi]|uniref:Chromosomal replication initiation ATPase DnaA n=1 Tax=Evansella vedderi TaxID=38282 RepID=A0ABU0A0L4_9BACI|nr:DnaA N-terminal domain-containing protein [Evansella vedderi]MDQ0257029.1 chromosomal replication initiation ATPase DnaA [Evansella vedderi]
MDIREIWNEVKSLIKVEISEPAYDTWIKETEAFRLESNKFTVSAHNEFARDWLENRYKDQLEANLQQITGEKLKLYFILADRPIPSPSSKESRRHNVEFLLEEYLKDEEQISNWLLEGKSMEDICLEMDVKTREDVNYIMSIVRRLSNGV